MSQVELPNTTPVSETDMAAITSLFKRIGERGHRIRLQASSVSSGAPEKSIRGNEDSSRNEPTSSEGE